MARKDIHRPSAITPEDYAFVGVEYDRIQEMGYIHLLASQREVIRQHMARTGGTYSAHEHKGNCHVCGAHCIYTALFHHAKTNVYIRTGFDCAAKLDMGDESLFRRCKEAVDVARKAKAGKLKAQGVLEQHGLSNAYQIWLMETDFPAFTKMLGFSSTTPTGILSDYAEDNGLEVASLLIAIRDLENINPNRDRKEERIVADIVSKLVQYGSLSARQIEFLQKLMTQITDRPAAEIKKQVEKESAPDVPEGRLTLECEILSFKEQDSQFGMVTKMLVKAAAGFKLWGTCPRSMNANRGDKIELTATVTRSDRDSKFGFFSRPTARILNASPTLFNAEKDETTSPELLAEAF